jgi:two-component system chemotaxis sensor kinase CheA
MDLSKYRQLYVSETQENLEKMSRLLVELEQKPDDREAIDTIFRLAHSIKGMSGTMGYSPMFELAHLLEDLMDRFRRDRMPMTGAAVDALLEGVDRMTQWVADVEAERLPLQQDDRARSLDARVKALLDQTPPPLTGAARDAALGAGTARTPAPPTPSPVPAAKPAFDIREGDLEITLTVSEAAGPAAVRGYLAYKKLAELGTLRASEPPVERLRAGHLDGPLRLALDTPLDEASVREFLSMLPDITNAEVARYEEPIEGLTFSMDFGGPAPAASGGSEGASSAPASADRDVEPAAAAIVRAPKHTRTIRVRTDWLDTILNRTGDMMIVSQRLWNLNRQRGDPVMAEALSELSKLLNALHQDALSVRMMPLSVVTGRLPRVVRDLAKSCGKRASLVVRGDDQQLDRAILEGLDAPLTHILRNAVEHGIETAERRIASGKSAAGLLTLDCLRVRDEIVVEVSDDGGGIDRARLIGKAVDLDLMNEERARALAERDLTSLVCLPSLSASDSVGAMAGRGVGMDAVRDSITALGGRVEVTSEPGAGTTVRLRLPRTPGISKLLVVEADGQTFGMPLGRILQTEMIPSASIEQEKGAQYATHRDQRLRVHPLRHLLGFPEAADNRDRPGVIFAGEEGPFLLIVDRVVGQQDAVIKPLGPLLERIDGLLGVTLDTVGQPVFVIDVPRFMVLPT